MKYLVPLLLALAIALPGCNSTLDVAPGFEAYQAAEGPDGRTSEARQGVRVRVGTVKTEAAPQAAAEKADSAAGKFQAGASDQREAAKDAVSASQYLLWGAIALGVMLFLSTLVIAVALLLRRK